MKQEDRHNKIISIISESGFATIEELAAAFAVTPQTIRRDLTQLNNENRLQRFHGGAGIASSTLNTPYKNRQVAQLEEKKRIAEQVALAIPDHASLFINIGTTTEAIAKALLGHSGLTIITNNLHVASILSSKDDFKIIVAGGTVRNKDGGIMGEATIDFISQFSVDYAIIGISGIDQKGEMLDYDFQEVRVSKEIMRNSRNILLAADHSKFGRNAMARLGNIAAVDQFFTSAKPPASICQIINEHQVKLVIA